MANRWLLNLALAVLIGALVLLAVFKPGNRPESSTTPLMAVDGKDVSRLRLLRPKQPEVVVEKRGGEWRVVSPYPARANRFRANELAALATSPVRARFAAKPEELGKYGLDRPLATVFLDDAEIRFGAMHPLHNEIYVLHAGQVQLIPAAAFRAATVPVADLLSPALFADNTKLVALRLPGFSLKQNEQGAWVRTPASKDLGSDRINRFVDEWLHARALTVAPARKMTTRERATITITSDGQTREIGLSIVARKPELVLVRHDEKLEYHFLEEAASRLLELKPGPEPETTALPAGANTAN